METATLIVVLVIVLALFFDFTNGFHDTANAMATPIATGALKPKVAVLLAADPEPGRRVPVHGGRQDDLGRHHPRGPDRSERVPAAHLRRPDRRDHLEHVHVAARPALELVARPVRRPDRRDDRRRRAGWRSTSASCAQQGDPPGDPGARSPRASSPSRRPASPTRSPAATTRKPDGRDGFRWGQIFTSSLVALAHGTNDAQKTMGVITLTLIIAGWQSSADPDPQTWVIFACAHHDRARHLHGRLAHHPHARQGPHRRQARAGLLAPSPRPPPRSSPPAPSASRCRPLRSPPAR